MSGNALDYDFTTNEVGNITEVASASEGTQKLVYDRLDRLSEVRAANLALIEAYTYDATGNRLSQRVGTNPVTSYNYPAQNHRLTQVGAAARSFDAVGNTLTGVPGYEADSATYDVRNRLTQVATGTSAQLLSNYSGRGERVLASQGAPAPALPTTSAAWTTSAGVRGYVYDEAGQVISMLIAGNPLRYEEIVWLDNTPIGRVLSSTSAVLEVHAIHSDHLNTPRALANAQTQGGQAAGTVVWRWKLNSVSATGSNAFGTQPAEENPDGNGTSIRFDLRFPGQQYDAATGVNYNYFRDYEPSTGRYVESDPIGLQGGMSTYSYVRSSPFAFVDPLGLDSGGCWYTNSCGGQPVEPPAPLVNDEVMACVCKYMREANYDSSMAFHSVNKARKGGKWNDPILRPCENYIYAYAAISSYGDNHVMVHAGVGIHALKKPFSSGTSNFNEEAMNAGTAGANDGSVGRNLEEVCKDGCKN